MTAVRSASRYFTIADLCERFGVSRMWIYRRVNASRFPASVHLAGGRLARWPIDAVERWEADADNHVPPALNVGAAQ
jgi:predicted DNA-binding transcriptional regulator AlpA